MGSRRVPYFWQVTPRFTTELIAAVLTATTAFGLLTVATPRVSYGAVRIDSAQRPVQRNISEQRDVTAFPRKPATPSIPKESLSRPVPLLHQPLFQRPPPVPSRSRT